VLIHSLASLRLRSETLTGALTEVAGYAREHLVAAAHSEVAISIGERGARIHQVLAPLLPADAKEFYLGTLRVGAPLTAGQFLSAVARSGPLQTHSLITLGAAALRDPLSICDELSRVVPATGRGVTLLFILRGWRFREDAPEADVDLTLSRFRHGARAISAGLSVRFLALSLKDPAVKTTIAAASACAGVPFGRAIGGFAAAANVLFGAPATPIADERLKAPEPQSQLTVLKTFDEALARASDESGAKREDLASLPLLFSRTKGFDKRLHDVMAGKNESINLPARLKRFVRDQFSSYDCDAADAEQLWFRRSIAPTLDLLLMFDRVHQSGLGKTFTVDFGADFPNTPLGGLHTGLGGTRRNIFWLFHEAWEKQVWVYTTKAELDRALESCAAVLTRVLPALERNCRELLVPIPTELPDGIEQRGRISAREAYEIVLPLARAWAPDVELESIGTVSLMTPGDPLGSIETSVGDDGRLRNPGSWGFKFLSRRLDRYVYYTVPHTGRIWWNFYPVLQGARPKYGGVLPADGAWLNSTAIAPRAVGAMRERLDGLRIREMWLALREPQRSSGHIVWEATGIGFSDPAHERCTVTVHIDRETGEILDVEKR